MSEHDITALWRRVLAHIVDGILVFFIFGYVMASLFGQTTAEGFSLSGGPAFVYFVLVFAYFIALESRYGYTAGKRVLGIMVVGADGNVPDLGDVTARNLLRIVDVFPFCYIVGLISIVLSDDDQRIGDRFADTYVVDMEG